MSPPNESGWSNLNPVFSSTRALTNIIDFFIANDVGDHKRLPQFK